MLTFLCTGTLGASLLLGDYGFGVSAGILMYLCAHSWFICMSAFLVVQEAVGYRVGPRGTASPGL